jgi:hypothetical protein
MDAWSKATLSCVVAIFLLFAGVITFFVMLDNSLESHPIKGWQEGPHTPHPPLRIFVSPEASGTAKSSTEKAQHP